MSATIELPTHSKSNPFAHCNTKNKQPIGPVIIGMREFRIGEADPFNPIFFGVLLAINALLGGLIVIILKKWPGKSVLQSTLKGAGLGIGLVASLLLITELILGIGLWAFFDGSSNDGY